MPSITTIHFNSNADAITVEEDFATVQNAVKVTGQLSHDFVRVVGDNRSRVTILKNSIAFVEETEVVEPFLTAI
jgi:hypothetical protein